MGAVDPLVREILAGEPSLAWFGFTVDEAVSGRAVASTQVGPEHVNANGMAHGGFVFALADTAFAIACNEDERVTVAAGADITFLKSTRAGQTLTATARRRTLSGRNGLYDVTVTDETGDVVAEFRGRSLTTNRIAEEDPNG